MEKSKCIIFTGGEKITPSGFVKSDFKDAYIIAADSGCSQVDILNNNGFGISVDLLLGDMDSYSREAAMDKFSDACFLPFPPEKDYTDTQLALKVAREKGFSDIEIIGGTGGRIDHTLSNLALLRKESSEGIFLSICDGKNLIFYSMGGSLEIEKSENYKYFSLIPDSEDLIGVTITGAKYTLCDATVGRDLPVTVSNEITSDVCEIDIKKGSCFVIFSRD